MVARGLWGMGSSIFKNIKSVPSKCCKYYCGCHTARAGRWQDLLTTAYQGYSCNTTINTGY